MATLDELELQGALIRHEADLGPRELPERQIYFAPEFYNSGLDQIEGWPRVRGRNVTPYEQVEQVLYEFVVGEKMVLNQHHKLLNPLKQYVWELRPIDVRVFGWFARRANFIVVAAELKSKLKTIAAYKPFIDQTIQFRDGLDLDAPKLVTGIKANEIL